MGLVERFRDILPARLKQFVYVRSSDGTTRDVAFTAPGNETIQGYSARVSQAIATAYRHPIVCIAVNWIVKQASSTPLFMEQQAEEKEDVDTYYRHPMLELLNKPSEDLSGSELLAVTYRDMLTAPQAQAFWRKERSGNGSLDGLTYLQSRRVVVKGSRERLITHYEYSPDMGGPPIRYEPEEIVHIRLTPNPDDPKNGLSPLVCVANELVIDTQSQTFMSGTLENQGAPGGLLMPPVGEQMTRDTARETKDYIKREFRGTNRGDLGVLLKYFDYIETGLSPQGMAISDTQNTSEARICGALGIHPVVLGLGAGDAQSRVGAATTVFQTAAWRNGVVPLQDSVAQQITRQVMPDFIDEEELDDWLTKFDRKNVLALQPDLYREAQRWNLLVRAGIAMRHTALTAQNIEASDNDKIYLIPAGTTIVPEDTPPEEVALLLGQGSTPEPEDSEDPPRQGEGEVEETEFERREAMRRDPRQRILAYLRSKATLTPEQRALFDTLDSDLTFLSQQFAGELEAAFDDLGDRAERAFWAVEGGESLLAADDSGALLKQGPEGQAELAEQILGELNIEQWEQGILIPAWDNHTLRTMNTTVGSINSTMGLGVNLPDPVGRRILETGGTRRGLIDFTDQTRSSLYRSIAQAHENGEGPIALARRIRSDVPAGPFVHAGPKYRAELIARTETKFSQNRSTLEAYQAAPQVQRVLIFDAQLGDTDAPCLDLDGTEWTLQEAQDIGELEHPLCTRSFAPVIDGPVEAVDQRFDISASEFEALDNFVEEYNHSSLNDYVQTPDTYEGISRAMRTGAELNPHQKQVVDDIKNLARQNEALRGRLAFRGMGVRPGDLDQLPQVGGRAVLQAPTSTSLSHETAFGFMRHNSTYRLSDNTPVMLEIRGTSRARAILTNSAEQEILLAPGMRYEVLERITEQVELIPAGPGREAPLVRDVLRLVVRIV